MADIAFNHGVRVTESADAPVLIRTAQSAVAVVIDTADVQAEADWPMHTPQLIKGAAETGKLAKLPPGSPLRRGIEAVQKQQATYVYGLRVPKGADLNEAVNNAIGSPVDLTGVHALKRIYEMPEFERKHRPRLVAMPVAAGVPFLPAVQELVSVLAPIKAVAFVDGPDLTGEAAVAWRNQFGSDRVYPIDPRLLVKNTYAAGVIDPAMLTTNSEGVGYIREKASPFFAGVQARVDAEQGFWWSASNKPIYGISGVSRPVAYGLQANYLNENGVNTVIPGEDGGWITWGNRMATDAAFKMFLSVRRTTDIINEAIEREYRRFNDRPMTIAEAKMMLESGRRFMRDLKAEGAIYGGDMFWDEERNTDSELAQGRVTLGVRYLVPPPMEDIRIIQHYEMSYFAVLRNAVVNDNNALFQAIAA